MTDTEATTCSKIVFPRDPNALIDHCGRPTKRNGECGIHARQTERSAARFAATEVPRFRHPPVEDQCSYCDDVATHIGDGQDGDSYCPNHLSRAYGTVSPMPTEDE